MSYGAIMSATTTGLSLMSPRTRVSSMLVIELMHLSLIYVCSGPSSSRIPYSTLQLTHCTTLQDDSFLDPVILVRNSILRHEHHFAPEANTIVATIIEEFRASRMLTTKHTVSHSASPPTADEPMLHLEQRLIDFYDSIHETPRRPATPQRSRANQTIHDIITAQYNIALFSPYGQALHTRDPTYQRQQEFLFRSNMAEQLARFGHIPDTDYSLIVPSTRVSPHPTPRPVSPFSQGLVLAHAEQQQLQRDHITETGLTSNEHAKRPRCGRKYLWYFIPTHTYPQTWYPKAHCTVRRYTVVNTRYPHKASTKATQLWSRFTRTSSVAPAKPSNQGHASCPLPHHTNLRCTSARHAS